MKRPMNAVLQNAILLSLAEESAPTVTALSKRLDAHRPSVSRALHSLEADGLVVCSKRIWSLSEEGQYETERLRDSLTGVAEKSAAILARLIKRTTQIDKATATRAGTTISELVKKMNASGAINPQDYKVVTDFNFAPKFDAIILAEFQVDQARRISEGFAESLSSPLLRGLQEQGMQASKTILDSNIFDDMRRMVEAPALFHPMQAMFAAEDIKSAISGVLDVQRASISLLAERAITDAAAHWDTTLQDTIGKNNALVSSMASDLWAMSAAKVTPDLEILGKSLTDMVRAYDDYSLSNIADLTNRARLVATESLLSSTNWMREDIMLPTLSTSLAVRSSYRVVEHYERPDSIRVLRAHTWQETAFEFEAKLSYNPQLLKRWRGAWDTLHSNSRDRVPQAALSARELLNHGLAEMAPDDAFTAEEIARSSQSGKVTRKMRARRALGGHGDKQVDWVENMAKTLDSLYDVLSGQVHNRGESDEFTVAELESVLVAAGGCLAFVISRHQRPSSN